MVGKIEEVRKSKLVGKSGLVGKSKLVGKSQQSVLLKDKSISAPDEALVIFYESIYNEVRKEQEEVSQDGSIIFFFTFTQLVSMSSQQVFYLALFSRFFTLKGFPTKTGLNCFVETCFFYFALLRLQWY